MKILKILVFVLLLAAPLLAQTGTSWHVPVTGKVLDTVLVWAHQEMLAHRELFVGRLTNVQTVGDSFVFSRPFSDTNYVCLYEVKAVDGTVVLGTVRVREQTHVRFYPPESGVTIEVIATILK